MKSNDKKKATRMTKFERIKRELYMEIVDSIEYYGYTNVDMIYIKESLKYFISTEEYEYCLTIKNYIMNYA